MAIKEDKKPARDRERERETNPYRNEIFVTQKKTYNKIKKRQNEWERERER